MIVAWSVCVNKHLETKHFPPSCCKISLVRVGWQSMWTLIFRSFTNFQLSVVLGFQKQDSTSVRTEDPAFKAGETVGSFKKVLLEQWMIRVAAARASITGNPVKGKTI